MNQAPNTIAPIPVLPPFPAQDLPQANWQHIANAFDTLATETANIPNFAPAQQLDIIATHLGHMTTVLNHLVVLVGNLSTAVTEANSLSPIRLHNASASTTARLRYPNNAPIAQLPQTKADAIELSGASAAAASALLGLAALPPNSTALERRRQFLDHIGVFI